MYLQEISEVSYKNSDLPILFEDNLTDRMFGIISNDIHSFKFGWQSTIVKPIIKEANQKNYAIGIDQNFVLIDLNLVRIRLKLELSYFFYNMVVLDDLIIVITELEILIVNLKSFSLLTTISLPELYEKMEINGKDVRFICIDGNEVDFDLNGIKD
ncbi:hypothetical protein C8D70_12415 [Chryseobacterium sp. CBTAP 102]|uniref:hypothetical protein n=1 Tax=Chryseobacterium sp. CBTAP 102 TaxID=2135644 RepID=UPI000D761BD6|nr:hypothetical protein [Chryseobacterium sp. CBTAP 102]PXW06932.1 hypothetical protein C8D70_12415 [Chryseobacterium sp. CBTAP 102]